MRRLTASATALCVLPFLLLLLYIGIYSINGPEWDHVNSAEIFDRWDRGAFTLEYLFRPHNEHRKAAVRLVILGLGLMTRWNNRVEAFAHWALMAGTALLLYRLFRRDTALDSRPPPIVWFIPIAALLASPRSYDALLGDGFPHYLSILGIVGALGTLVFAPLSPARLAGAIAFGLLASFSLSNGLLIWPVGVLVLLADTRVSGTRRSWRYAAVWGAAGVATIVGYFIGYKDPGNHSSPWLVVQHPTIAITHYLYGNGSSLAPEPHSALVFGAIVLVLAIACLLLVAADWWWRRLRPPLGAWLIVMVLVGTVMITLNRAGFGTRQALESRYTAMLVLGPIGVYWCVVARRASLLGESLRGALAISIATILAIGYLAASLDAWTIAPYWYSRKAWMSYLMYSAKYQPTSVLEKLYPNGEHARIYSAAMERMHFNVFADPHVVPESLTTDAPRSQYEVNAVNGRPPSEAPIEIGESDAITVNGYAFSGDGRRPARAVFFTIDGTRDLPAHMGVYGLNLGGGIRGRQRRWSGFSGSFGGFVLPPGEHTVALKIVPDGSHAFVTPPIARIIRR